MCFGRLRGSANVSVPTSLRRASLWRLRCCLGCDNPRQKKLPLLRLLLRGQDVDRSVHLVQILLHYLLRVRREGCVILEVSCVIADLKHLRASQSG